MNNNLNTCQIYGAEDWVAKEIHVKQLTSAEYPYSYSGARYARFTNYISGSIYMYEGNSFRR